MVQYEYKVIPAPTKGKKGPGVKTAEARFAYAIEGMMNDLAADGWIYLRSDLLPSEERQGLTSSQTVYRSVLVFRREVSEKLPDVFEQIERSADTASEPTPPPEADRIDEGEPVPQPPSEAEMPKAP